MTELHTVLGSGPAGSAVVDELLTRGHAVRWVDRSSTEPSTPEIERVRADLTDPAAATSAIEGADVVYHCVNVAYHLQVEIMPRVADAVLAATERAGGRLVVLDTLYPYGPTDGDHITEQTPWAATSRKGRMRAELDQRYLDAHAAGRVRTVAGRAADFFGPRVLNSTLGGAFFPAALAGGRVLTMGDIDLPHSYSYIRDVARGLVTLGETPAGDGRIWHLPTNPARTTRAVMALVGEIVGRPLEWDNLPEARAVGPFDETFMAEYAEMFYQHTTPQNMVSAAFEERFGVHPTPLPEALAATVDWYRRQG